MVHGIAIVPFLIDGVSSAAMVDTGSNITLISPDLATKIKPALIDKQLYGLSAIVGHLNTRLIVVNRVQVGQVSWTHPILGVADIMGGSKRHLSAALLGLNFLRGLDVDLDFAHGKIVAYGTANCVHAEPPWQDSYSGVPLTWVLKHTHVTIPVIFDGGELEAVVDTGAVRSVITREAASRIGVTAADYAKDPVSRIIDLGGEHGTAREHIFPEIVVGEDLFRNFHMLIVDKISTEAPVDMILGTDYLAQHHIWLSLSTNALYIDSGEKAKPRSGPAPAPNQILIPR